MHAPLPQPASTLPPSPYHPPAALRTQDPKLSQLGAIGSHSGRLLGPSKLHRSSTNTADHLGPRGMGEMPPCFDNEELEGLEGGAPGSPSSQVWALGHVRRGLCVQGCSRAGLGAPPHNPAPSCVHRPHCTT